MTIALAMQHLLRLPPSLRSQILSNASFLARPLESHQYQQHARLFLRRSYATAKAPPKPRPIFRSSPSPPTPPPTPRTVPPSQKAFSKNPYVDRLTHNSDQVLIYNSPSHTAYTLMAFFSGGCFLAMAWNSAVLSKSPTTSPAESANAEATAKLPPTPWWTRWSLTFVAIASASLGTMFILAPTKIIRRIWLLPPQQIQGQFGTGATASYSFKIETKSILPFRQGRTITTPIHNVAIDRSIAASAADFSWHNVPLSSSAAFTNHYLPSTHPSNTRATPNSATIASRVKGFNSALLNAWPALRGHAKRMFIREGIAYVHIIGEDGQWKLDLQNAEVLDRAQPVTHLMQTDGEMAKGVVPFLQRIAARLGATTGR